jgi:hypothetical protein
MASVVVVVVVVVDIVDDVDDVVDDVVVDDGVVRCYIAKDSVVELGCSVGIVDALAESLGRSAGSTYKERSRPACFHPAGSLAERTSSWMPTPGAVAD